MNLILGIETSCDETAAAVVAGGRRILSQVVATQIDLHRRYGGVFPEMAARQHVQAILPVAQEALAQAGVGWQALDAIAVTQGPGLAGSLLVGLNAAKGMAWAHSLPLIGVNHLEGHIYSNWLDAPGNRAEKTFPLLVLIVSGGHTDLFLMRGHGQYQRLGGTIDDAAGEAFDKVARLLGLGYPGGPAIERAAAAGQSAAYDLPRAWLPGTHDFSFSGLKTATLRIVQTLETGDPASGRKLTPGTPLSPRQQADLAASFQAAVVDVLVGKTLAAAAATGAGEICVCGGVAANTLLRQRLQTESPLPISMPPLRLCTDNAAMIAAAAFFLHPAAPPAPVLDQDAIANLSIHTLAGV
ncbi:MAG: tRNA (adenosine(37)-N6)-threonylcarbamoyltransferase complex transferase subunit TsaD [Caldilineales bacterium]|nr:tRNA (adenosine(37)-N6)-threonylcarbamoyltransferase complex transferase subunit TsaD [Caldilineales bacterium]